MKRFWIQFCSALKTSLLMTGTFSVVMECFNSPADAERPSSLFFFVFMLVCNVLIQSGQNFFSTLKKT
ncbi:MULTISPECIES: hypothetical protein [unclassified Iodobacter]|uniref:hypothetical protein n=1 Tax=unclassified Iodobacter TaxID=235634 RepID=UPI0025F39FAB|nr:MULTISPECIES: hypothetical protein [unclassified Iodobacter]MDW5415411.1 hypothetical protein [Iodobacter sp. CM08]